MVLLFYYKASFNVPNYLSEEEEEDISLEFNPEVKRLELEAIKLSESCSYNCALDLIEEALKLDQNDPSIYNNKAQILRLIGDDNSALKCLNLAIKLSSATPKPKSSKKVLHLASAQRGWLHFRFDRIEEAFDDFERAGELGCLESRRMAVRCNHYAAMCNQMMQEIINNKFYYSK